jgi:hypothetical protein
VSQRRKLIEQIKRNPQGVRFDDACKVAEWLGFVAKATRGSHHAFARSGEATLLNFQNRNGKITTYQANQLIDMIEKYEEEA